MNIKEAKIEYRKNKINHDSKIKDEFDKLYKEDCEIKFSSVKKSYIYNLARNLSKQKAEYWLEKSFLQNNPEAKIVYAIRELSKIKNDLIRQNVISAWHSRGELKKDLKQIRDKNYVGKRH